MDNNLPFPGEKQANFLIVGIGASAGGIQALKDFFQQVPADSDLAFVVILHLSPDHDSQLAQALQAISPIPVIEVTEKVKLEPNHIYVVSPNHHLVMEDGFVIPSINLQPEERRAPVDIFFRTLAESHGSRAVCVVLSGTGANGSMGLKRIKEMGGVAFVQNPREAEYNEMPRNSIATELVDEVLPVAEIPASIISYRNSIGSVLISENPDRRPEQQQQALREIFTQLKLRTGHDFTNYKRATLLRRIERRINIHGLPSLQAYENLIQENPEETTALLKDLLISVTNFFRDQEPFKSLEENIVPGILLNKKADDQVRVWVAGCATGEEAYSIAILIAEHTMGVVDAPKIQIFATDIDEAAISIAREGFYTLSDTADVSADRLRRFFIKEEGGYRVRREIREMILFANHNFLKDPPFSRLNLISCRNVLIYLNHIAQERVMETFHFALNSGGYLFLGTSESVDGASDLYTVINRECHIFQAREVPRRHYPLPESVPKFLYSQNQSIQLSTEKEGGSAGRASFGELHQKLLEEYAPPSIVVNEEYEIVHMSEKAGRYLEFAAGEPTQNLLKLIRPEIRLELRTALYQAVQRQTAVEARNIKFSIGSEVFVINIHIRPVLNIGITIKGFLLVLFEPVEEIADSIPVMVSSDEPVAKQLEEELIRLKVHLRNSNEQHEFQQEELKAANEELQAMNEEMRSAAEELETSKEELQSINEELRTVNQELKIKIEEISLTSNNLQNLINSADVGTIFLDRSLRTRLFTPAVCEVFNLIPSDYGRPISDITNKLNYPGLLKDAETVLQKLTVIEREVMTTDNRYFMMRLLPYRTAEDRINGVVITFFDISKRRQTEQALRQSEQHLRMLIESAKDYAIFTLNTKLEVINWSTGAEMMIGHTEQEIIGQSVEIIFTEEDRRAGAPEQEAKKAEKNGRAENERWHVRKDGSRFWGSGSVSPLYDGDEKLIGFVKIMRDLTKSKEEDEQYRMRMKKEVSDRTAALKQSREQYASLVENLPDAITKWDKNLKLIFANGAFEQKTGIPNEKLYGKTIREMGQPSEIALPYMDSLRKVAETGEPAEHFNSIPTPKGSIHFYSRIVPEKNPNNEIESVLAIARDVTDLKNSQSQLIKAEERKKQAERQQFLLYLTDTLRSLDSCSQMQYTVCRALKEYLDASRVVYMETSERGDLEVVAFYDAENAADEVSSLLLLSDFSPETIKKDQSHITFQSNVSTDNRLSRKEKNIYAKLQIRAWSNAWRMKQGKLASILSVHYNEVHDWSDEELQLLEEIAERIWDATERTRAEEALRNTAERLQLALEAGNLGTYEYDFKNKMYVSSDQHKSNFGYAANEKVTLEMIKQRILPSDRAYMETSKTSDKNAVYATEYQVCLPNRDIRWIRSIGRFIYKKNGDPRKMVGISLDITEEKMFRAELSRQVEERTLKLKQSNDDLQQFAHVASHDFQEPVRKIKTFNNKILENYADTLPKRVKLYLDKIGSSADRLIYMIEGVLNYSKMGSIQASFVSVNLNKIIANIEEDLEVLISRKNAQIIKPKLPSIIANETLIYQLFYNLILNSLKFSRVDRDCIITISASVIKWNDKDAVEIIVSDNGIGFEQKYASSIFDTFTRLHSVSKFEGTGLGLALCKKIVERHHGTISANGKPESGAVFTIRLPFLKIHA
jgi:PAS domain S-box-containing protein